MTYPELYTDERVILQAQNVKVKSVVFEAILTTRRLVLIDAKKSSLPPQEINLATLKDVESGENAIRDPTITISIITISGNTRQMVLTFSKTSGGERRRECDEWVRALKQNITSTVYHPVGQAPLSREPEPEPAGEIPPSPPLAIDIPGTPPPKKRIETARPIKKIVEAPPFMPVPIETTSLPTGSFCNRCGSRIPQDSAFCNRCGTPVAQEPESANLPQEKGATQSAPAVQQVPVTLPVAAPEKKDRPIEEVIHSIEPLIEDSVPRTAPSPLVPPKQAYHTAPSDSAAEPGSQSLQESGPAAPNGATLAGGVQWPVLSQTPASDTAVPPAAPPTPPVSGPLPPLPRKKSPVKIIVVAALVILAVIAGVYIFMQGQTGSHGVTPTPTVTVPGTTLPKTTVTTIKATVMPTTVPQPVTTPQFLIPTSGVWVRVSYPSKFSGSVGTPEWVRQVEDTGDKFYQISTSTGPVVVSVQKSDGTSSTLAIDVYRDGSLIRHAETTSPMGIIAFQASLMTENATASPAS